MGYCYQGKKLCCDICGRAGARKYSCPFGSCSPCAACAECRKEHKDKFTKVYHRQRGCEASHLAFVAHGLQRLSMLNDGKALRCSALNCDTGRVHVLFERLDGSTEGWYMNTEVYRSIDLGINVTPDNYRVFGELISAPPKFSYGRTTKQVA